jgi:hypothetical protein
LVPAATKDGVPLKLSLPLEIVDVPVVIAEPVKATLLPEQIAEDTGDAITDVGTVLFVSTTSSVDAVQGLFEIVHLNVALEPTGTPVTPEFGKEGVVIVAVPLTTLHTPIPTIGVLPARVKLPLPQLVWSVPALAVVGVALFVSTTSSVDGVQGLFEIVHLKVALVPAGTPVTPEAGEDGVVIVAVPLTTLHAPVPTVAVLPASVKVLVLHLA